ncbi:MAG: TonB-dependent receptor family protein [Bacteroidota bacterium]|jgi:Fe(3+) dicitrate transport protein
MKFIFLLFLTAFFIKQIKAQTTVDDTITAKCIDQIIITGTKINSVPGSCQLIGQKTLEKLNQTNINNLIKTIPGVCVRDEEGFGLRPNIGLRGTQVNRSAKITLMEDGILIAPATYADPSAYYFPNLSRLQGIEILKGSSQIKYGPYTIGGALNLITHQIPESFQIHTSLGYGSFNTTQFRLRLGNSYNHFDYLIDANHWATRGFKELDSGDPTGFTRRDIMGKFRWHTQTKNKLQQSLTFKFVNVSEEAQETYLGLTYSDYQLNPYYRYAITQRDQLDLTHGHYSLHHIISPVKGLSLSSTIYYSTTFRDWGRANTADGISLTNIINNPEDYQLSYLMMKGIASGPVAYQNAARTYYSSGIQSYASYQFNTNKTAHKFHLGIRYHTDQADRRATLSEYTMSGGEMQLVSIGPNGNRENQIRDAESFAASISYDFRYKGLKLSPGLRYEKINFRFSNYGSDDAMRTGINLVRATNSLNLLLPGIGFNYYFNEQLNLFGGIHKGFSPPGMPAINPSMSQAISETSTNYESGLRLERNGMNLQSSLFMNFYENILGSDNISGGGAGTGDMFNAGNALIRGYELNMTIDVLRLWKSNNAIALPAMLTYTFTDARFMENFTNAGGDWGNGIIHRYDFIPFVTPHMLTAGLSLETKSIQANITWRYTGITRTKPGQGELVFSQYHIPAGDVNALSDFSIIDVTANYQISDVLTLFILINNLTNSSAIVANLPQGYRPNMPLSFNSGIKFHFIKNK